MFRRIAAILLCLFLVFTFITACQNDFTDENGENGDRNEVRVLLPEHPYADLLISYIHEFEEETGLKVTFEQMNEGDITATQVEAIENNTFVADVFMTRPMTETLNFTKNDWMIPLDGFDLSDYPENTLEIGLVDGKQYFVPLVVEWQVLYYRKDLLRAAGLSVPVSFEELEEAASILTKDGVAGFASRGAPSPAVSQLSTFIFNFGGRYIENGRAAFDSPEAVEAISFYGRLLGMYGPNGIYDMSWSEIMSVFQEGNVAMWTDASVFYGQLIDPEVSLVDAADIGVAKMPRGPAADSPYIMTSWGMSISSKTEDSDSAMEFLKWATSKEMAKKAMVENIPMARSSAWNDSEVADHMNPEIVETMIHASQYGYPFALPFMTSIVRARELIGEVISESVNTNGTSPRLQSLAAQNANEVNELLKADGEYGTAR